MKYANPEELANDMVKKAARNTQFLQTFPVKNQGVEMGKLFDANDLVLAVNAATLGVLAISYVKGNYTELSQQKGFDQNRIRATAFNVRSEAEAEMFAEVYSWRQAVSRDKGHSRVQINAFWERLTPGGQALSTPGNSVRDWRALMKATDEIGKHFDRVNGVVRSA